MNRFTVSLSSDNIWRQNENIKTKSITEETRLVPSILVEIYINISLILILVQISVEQ